jgi:HEAT repeat protein
MGPAARDAVAALKQSLQDKDVHWQAVLALLSVGPLAEALPELIRTLNTDSDWTLRSAAAQTLGRLGKEAQAAVPALIAALADKDSFVCSHAAEAIGSIGPAARAAIPALQNNHKRVRDSAAQALQLAQGAL